MAVNLISARSIFRITSHFFEVEQGFGQSLINDVSGASFEGRTVSVEAAQGSSKGRSGGGGGGKRRGGGKRKGNRSRKYN